MEKTATIKLHITDRHWFVRFLEILPGTLTWATIILPIILSVFMPDLVAYFIIAFDLFWMLKSFRMSYHLVKGYGNLHAMEKVDWNKKLEQLSDLGGAIEQVEQQIYSLLAAYPRADKRIQIGGRKTVEARQQYIALSDQLKELESLAERQATILPPDSLLHGVIIATYNESREILEPSIQALIDAPYPKDQIMLLIAYEERGGEEVERNAEALVAEYGPSFAYAAAIKHPDGIPGEVRGKGGNITYTGRKLTEYIRAKGIDPERVIVTTLDADNRASKTYFSQLSYVYATNSNRTHKSYQPIPMFTNNIWDAPAPMRVIATGNSFWNIIESMRPNHIRNFASHAQSLKTLIDTDYWSVTSIVEDGHQFWRTWFAYDGDHTVIPLYAPVYQDAVLANGYLRTFKVQYLQLRRWAWGVSDFPFVVSGAIRNPRIPFGEKFIQTWRLFEGHYSWATAPLIISFVAWLPLYLNHNFSEHVLAHLLPIIASRIMTVATAGLVLTVFISLISLPPKPERYRHTRFIGMIAQWVLLPVTSIVFSAFAAIDSQTRLMFGKYLDFRVTEKATKE